MKRCTLERLPRNVETVFIDDVGFMLVVSRLANGSKVLRDCEGKEWLFCRTYPVAYNARREDENL